MSDVVLPGGGVHFAFTRLVIPVIVVVIYVVTACTLLTLPVGVYSETTFLTAKLYLEGVPYFLVTMSFEVVVPVVGALDA